jgi:transposase
VAVLDHPHWKTRFEHLVARVGKFKAIVAIGRKLLMVLWHVLKREADRDARPMAVAKKLMRWGVSRDVATSKGLTRAAFVKKYLTVLGLGERLSSFSYGSKRVLLPPTVGERRLTTTGRSRPTG